MSGYILGSAVKRLLMTFHYLLCQSMCGPESLRAHTHTHRRKKKRRRRREACSNGHTHASRKQRQQRYMG